jgi:PAS domain S-box-containing protein
MGRGWTSVQARLTALTVAVTTLAVLALVLSRSSETHRIDAYLAADAKAHGELLDRTLELEGTSLAMFAADYTMWDEMVRFVETGDSTWASVNIDNGMGTYRANAAWVFDATGSLVYAARDSTLEALLEPLPPGLSVKGAFGNSHFCHFFIAGPDGPVEIRGATIHPSDDDKRKTPVRGYFLAARSWERPYLAELARVTGKTMRVEPARARAKPSAEIDRRSGVITFTRPLPGPQGKTELMLTASLQPGWIAVALRSGRGQFVQQTTVALLAILGLTLVLWFWVTRPLHWLRRGLESGSTEALKPLERNHTEFGQLAQLVGQFFGQNAALVKEVTERKQAETELTEQAERTKILFEYAPDAFYLSDFHGTFLDGNRAAEQMLGYQREELIGKSFLKLDMLPMSEVPRAAGLLVRNALGQATGPDELVLRRKDGTLLSVEVYTHVVTIHGSKVVIGSARDITERKRTEAALRDSEQRYRETIDALPEAVFETGPDGRLTLVNRSGLDAFGLAEADIARGVNVLQLLAPEDHERAAADIGRVMGGESRPGTEYTALRKDGSRFPAIVHADRIIRNGQPVGLRGILLDISVRKQVEDARRESEEKYRLVVDNASESILVAQDGKMVFANTRTSEIIGYPREELLGRTFIDFVHPDDRALVADNYIKRIAGENLPDLYEFRIVGRGGKTLYMEISAVRIDWKGRPATLNFLADVSGRRQAEDALRESEKRLRSITGAAKDAIIMVDDSGLVTFWNPAAEVMSGYAAKDALGRKLHEFLAPERFRAAHVNAFPHFQKTGEGAAVGKTVELVAVRRDGAEIPVELSMSAMPIKGKWHAVGIMRDITERKEVETELAQKAIELIELNDVKNQLLGMAAHDLRNPLSVVSTASSFLLEDAGRLLPEAKRTDFLRRINSSSEFMLRMIDDLLDVAKIEAGKLDLEFEDGDLCGLIEENLTMNRTLAEKKSIRLDFVPERGLPLFRFDRGKVEQVLNNLVSNALKFSEPGTAVTVQTSRVNGTVVVSVRDQGQGIPAEELNKLFKPFSKTSVRGTAGEKSTGLGLAICRKIVQGHHGRIWAESEVGKGSVFSFSLPVPVAAPE